jgi:hypothetical protein
MKIKNIVTWPHHEISGCLYDSSFTSHWRRYLTQSYNCISNFTLLEANNEYVWNRELGQIQSASQTARRPKLLHIQLQRGSLLNTFTRLEGKSELRQNFLSQWINEWLKSSQRNSKELVSFLKWMSSEVFLGPSMNGVESGYEEVRKNAMNDSFATTKLPVTWI